MIEEIEFRSEGAVLRGLLFIPQHITAKPPIVIMAHGTSTILRMVADKYADVFCRNGLAVLLYDHRSFGRSQGEPRQEINPWIQCRGYRDAAAFAETLSEIDTGRMALWGTATPAARW